MNTTTFRALSTALAMVACAGAADTDTARGIADTSRLPATTRTEASPRAAANPEPSVEATSIGGYGEIGYDHYLNAPGADQADLKRFVIFLSHTFDELWSLYSEVEWEHAVTSFSDQGESEIEQAWLSYAFTGNVQLKAGLFLMPIGLLNQSHEPPVFFGVERNEVETRIIPTTWREGGVGLYGSTASGFAWDLGLVTGFDLAKMDDAGYPLAASHQELQLAKASDLSGYGALNYQGISGLRLGAGIFAGNTLQDNADHRSDPSLPDFSGLGGLLTLGDVHAHWQHRGWDLEGLYTLGAIQQAGQIDDRIRTWDSANATAAHPYVPGEIYGWLVQAAYTVFRHGECTVTPFARAEGYDTELRMPAGFGADPGNADQVLTAGVSFKPISAIVVKADYQWFRKERDKERVNLGLGWMF